MGTLSDSASKMEVAGMGASLHVVRTVFLDLFVRAVGAGVYLFQVFLLYNMYRYIVLYRRTMPKKSFLPVKMSDFCQVHLTIHYDWPSLKSTLRSSKKLN